MFGDTDFDPTCDYSAAIPIEEQLEALSSLRAQGKVREVSTQSSPPARRVPTNRSADYVLMVCCVPEARPPQSGARTFADRPQQRDAVGADEVLPAGSLWLAPAGGLDSERLQPSEPHVRQHPRRGVPPREGQPAGLQPARDGPSHRQISRRPRWYVCPPGPRHWVQTAPLVAPQFGL
eukprot:6770183-Pyramimonas_sp.AAC.1